MLYRSRPGFLRHAGWLALALLLLVGASPVTADAHGITLFAWVDGDTVVARGKFNGGRPPVGSPIVVYDLAGRRLLEGTTDARGEFAFTPPKRDGLKIVLRAGSGHEAEWTLAPADFEPLPQGAPAATPGAAAITTPPAAALDAAQVEAIVERVVARRLAPVMRQLADSRADGPTLQDVVGGLGYILGLVGLAAYFRYRRRDPEATATDRKAQ